MKVEDTIQKLSYLKRTTPYFKFLKYVSVKMIRGEKVRNIWIDYTELTDEKAYTGDLQDLVNKALQEGLLVQHKSQLRFRLNSIFQALVTMG